MGQNQRQGEEQGQGRWSFKQDQKGGIRLGTHTEVFRQETKRHVPEDNEGNNATSISQQEESNERSFQGTRPLASHQGV